MLIFAERLDDKSGGPSVSIPEFSRALDEIGVNNFVFCKSRFLAKKTESNLSQLISYNSQIGLIFEIKRCLKKIPTEARVMHINFIWQIEILIVVLVGLFSRCKIVVNPRGMLNEEAFNSGSSLKRPFFKIIAKPLFLLGVSHFQCSSEEEVKTLKHNFPNKNIFLNSLGYKRLPKTEKFSIKDKFLTKTIVSISRVDSHKRIDLLIAEFINSGLGKNGWNLEIFGASKIQDYEEFTQHYTKKDILDNNISLNLFIENLEKVEVLNKATFFISTSNSESFGLSIAESFDVGTPVIIRNNTIWENYIKSECGISFDNKTITEAFKNLINLDFENYQELVLNIDRHYNPISWYDHTKLFLKEINYNL